ncbi:DUF1080 domain-containing protein [bacterium]|nr:DUF1080 domain-containing protein [bacterium]
MKKSHQYPFIIAICFLFLLQQNLFAQPDPKWRIHDSHRPAPPFVTPAPQGQMTDPPSDAVVLFSGTDLSAWEKENGDPVTWKVENGYMEVTPRGGTIRTKQGFGDCQLHIEWLVVPKEGVSSQNYGNSGVFLMSKYEVQVLNSYDNKTYVDGQAGAVYGQYPPVVNASRAPGEWQCYDILFRRPHFDDYGNLEKPAQITVLHNGVLVQDHVEPVGSTEWQQRPPYEAHPDKLPLMLQDHSQPVRFRNIWIRELEPYESLAERAQPPVLEEIVMDEQSLERYVGEYGSGNRSQMRVEKEGDQLIFYRDATNHFPIFPQSETTFFSKMVDVTVEFSLDENGEVQGLTYILAGEPGRMMEKL